MVFFMKKKIVATIMTLTMAAGLLAGCGNADNNTAGSSEAQSSAAAGT